MSTINFGDGDWDEAKRVVQQLLQDHHNTIHGNGKEGMLTTLNNFITEYRENRRANIEFQDKRDKEQAQREARRWRVAGAILAFLTLAVGWLTYRDSQRKVSVTTPPVVSLTQQAPQDAGLPVITQR